MSSTILNASFLPHFGRLRNQLGGCAWIPATSADNNSSWLQVDLGNLTNVSAVATQGSCSGDQWTKSYVITYSKGGVHWKHYGELGTIRVSMAEYHVTLWHLDVNFKKKHSLWIGFIIHCIHLPGV